MKLRLAAGAAVLALTCFAAPAAADGPAPAPAPATTTAPTASATSTTTAPAAATSETPPAPTGKRTVLPWILMGTGVALVVTAIVLEVSSVREDDKREAVEVKLSDYQREPASNPDKQRLQKEKDDHESSASTQRTAALIVGTVGILTVAGSVVLWFYEGSKTDSPPTPSARFKPTFRPALGPSYAGGMLGASF
jgi:hypothetical protein